MAIRYKYNGATYDTLYELRNAVWLNQRIVMDALPDNPQQLAQLGITVEDAEYDPMLEMNLEDLRQYALNTLKQVFNTYSNSEEACVVSSLGFKVSSNYATLLNVQGLRVNLASAEATVTFRDYDNVFHELTSNQLVTLVSEIVSHGQSAYAKFWQYEQSIKNAIDTDSIKAILNNGFDFD